MKSQSIEQARHTPDRLIITIILVAFCVMWTIPTLGIFITSFHTADAASSVGWWKSIFDFKTFTLDNYNQVLFGFNHFFCVIE